MKTNHEIRNIAIHELEDEDGDYFYSEVEIFIMGYNKCTSINIERIAELQREDNRKTILIEKLKDEKFNLGTKVSSLEYENKRLCDALRYSLPYTIGEVCHSGTSFEMDIANLYREDFNLNKKEPADENI